MRIFALWQENPEKQLSSKRRRDSILFASLILDFINPFSFNLIGAVSENNQTWIGRRLETFSICLLILQKERDSRRIWHRCIFLKILRRSVHWRIRDADVANRCVSLWFRGLPGWECAFVCSLYYCQYWLCWLTLEHSLRQPAPASCRSASHRVASLHSPRIRERWADDRDFPSVAG